MMGYRQQRPKIGLTVCLDLVDHYSELSGPYLSLKYNALDTLHRGVE